MKMHVWGLAVVCLAACGDKKAGSAEQKGVTGAGVTGAGGAPAAKPEATGAEKDKGKGKAKRAEKPSKDKQKAYSAALKRGRKAARAKDWAGASKAFEECLTLAPDDAMALSELGWALYSAGDLARAEEITRHAVAVANEPRFKGAGLYNLGMIQLAGKNTEAAIQSFKDSLRARPNATVRGALAKLDVAAAKEFELFAPSWLKASGSPDEECKKLAAAAGEAAKQAPKPAGEDADWAAETCTCSDPVPGGVLAKAEGEWKAVKIIATSCSYDDDGPPISEVAWDLYVQTKDGWFRRPGIASIMETPRTMGEAKLEELALRPGPGGSLVLLVRTTESSEYMGGGAEETAEVESLLVAGIGASGKPSATPSLELRHRVEGTNYDEDVEDPETYVSLDASFDWSFTPAGEVKLDAKTTKGMDGKAVAEVVGIHAITFP